MTYLADGTRTLPMRRGSWVLRELLHDPPNNPPPNAGEIQPNTSGKNLTVRQRLELAAQFLPHKFERTRPDGRIIEIAGNPIEGGGMVATYTDVTERRRTEKALQDSFDELRIVLDNIDYRLRMQRWAALRQCWVWGSPGPGASPVDDRSPPPLLPQGWS